jgi:hypothetical protein
VSKQFWTFLAIGLAVVASGIAVMLVATKGDHLDLVGEVLKVRTFQMNPNASLVIVDFRVTNPSDVGFVVKTVEVQLEPATGEIVTGQSISKPDVENVFKYEKLLGPKYNDVLSIKDKIAPHEKVDRMVGARFELGESGIEARKAIRLRIHDLDGTVVELVEKRK